MSTQLPDRFLQLPIYKKAIEIFNLAQNISEYLVCDLGELTPDGKEKYGVYFSGDIVQQSTSLAPEILKAEMEVESSQRKMRAARVRRLTQMLYRNSFRLEKCQSNGRDYLPILRKELKKFRKLQRTWMLTL
ncbi:MAG: hypothetical protein R3213_07880 [Flavobacteriaceae bacterium]|nr:hypothetical protein [Flavobacteriaceae bacterium]